VAETPYAETEALLAVLREDEDEALRIVDDMLPGERRRFVEQLDRLSLLADDTQRCPGCNRPTDPRSSVSVGQLFGPRRHGHSECLDAQRAEDPAEVHRG
jgi:hypothetical protein